MKYVKEICPKCGTAIEYTKKEKLIKSIVNSLTSILMVMGILFIIYLSLVGIGKPLNDMTNAQFRIMSRDKADEMRLIALDILEDEDCGANSVCYASRIYANVSKIKYVPSSLFEANGMYDPLYVYENGGDCKNTANMYVTMLNSVGIKADVDCSFEEKHCVSVVPFLINDDYMNKRFVVDLTIPMVVFLEDGEEVWEYYDIAEKNNSRILGWDYIN